MNIVLQKTYGMGLIALNEKDYSNLPQNFLATVDDGKGMTAKQRGSLHVWCGQVAKVLNEAGELHEKIHPFTKKIVVCQWTKNSVKEDLYKPTLESYTKKTSTEDQTTTDPSLIAEGLAMAYSKYYGIVLPFWPSRGGL